MAINLNFYTKKHHFFANFLIMRRNNLLKFIRAYLPYMLHGLKGEEIELPKQKQFQVHKHWSKPLHGLYTNVNYTTGHIILEAQ